MAQQPPKATTPAPKPPVVVKPDNSAVVIAQQAKSIDDLEKKVKSLETEVTGLTNSVYGTLWNRVTNLEHPSATFDPSSPGPYQRIETDVGPMLISLGKAEQYLDGYSVRLEVGNTTAASLIGFKVTAKWSQRFKKEEGTYWDWMSNLKTKEFSLTGTAASGKWTSFSIILPDTKPTDFGYLEVSIAVNTVSMPTTSISQ